MIGLPFLSGGAALIVYIVAGVSLRLGIVAVLVLSGGTLLAVRHRLPDASAGAIRSRVARGALAGLAATLAYDACRLLVVTVFGLRFWPFDTFIRFGHLLAGDGAPSVLAIAVGTAYHYANGTGFAIAYVLFVRRPGIVSGVLWAALLEALMVSLYPGWLGIRATGEFLDVSVIGHLAYGVVLGTTARALLNGRSLRASDEIRKSKRMA